MLTTLFFTVEFRWSWVSTNTPATPGLIMWTRWEESISSMGFYRSSTLRIITFRVCKSIRWRSTSRTAIKILTVISLSSQTSRNWPLALILIQLIGLSVIGSLMRQSLILHAESFQTSSSCLPSCTGAEVVATVRRMDVWFTRAFLAPPSVSDRHCAVQML